MIENLPKGALQDKPDARDYQLMGAPTPVDWSKGSGLPRPPLKDQDSSDSCVSHAWSYYHWQLKRKDYSCRDIFANIAQGYGAYIRDGGLHIVNKGQATTDEVPDPVPETPQNMRDKTGITLDKESSDQELNSFVLPGDIDTVASSIFAYKGVVLGVNGSNEGWHDLTNPRPPLPSESQWGHALYAIDFHVHPDGQKCIICVTSWPKSGVIEHHLRQDYFNSNNVFNPWTLIPKGDLMNPNVKTINIDGTIYAGFALSDPKDIPFINKFLNINLIQNPDGSIPTDIVAHK